MSSQFIVFTNFWHWGPNPGPSVHKTKHSATDICLKLSDSPIPGQDVLWSLGFLKAKGYPCEREEVVDRIFLQTQEQVHRHETLHVSEYLGQLPAVIHCQGPFEVSTRSLSPGMATIKDGERKRYAREKTVSKSSGHMKSRPRVIYIYCLLVLLFPF